jgi:serine/threonine protein kinase
MLQNIIDKLQAVGCIMHGFAKQYELGQLLGLGSFAKVFYAENTQTRLPVAAKIVQKKGPAEDMALQVEACMLRRSHHPGVLKFFGMFLDVDPLDGRPAWIIVTEFVSGGELFERLRKQGPLPEIRAASIAYQLLSSLKTMHERDVVHRDIKTENVILVDIERDDVKLVDFGLATQEWDKESMVRRCGSPGYVAPEVLKSETYGCKVDCFSIGVLLHILLVGRGPFHGKTVEEMLVRNLQCNVKQRRLAHLSERAQDLVLSLLNPDPRQRPSAAECLEHSWFTTLSKSLLDQSQKQKCTVTMGGESPTIPSLKVEADRFSTSRNRDAEYIAGVECQSPVANFACNDKKDCCPDDEEVLNGDAEEEAKDIARDSLPLLRSQTPITADMQETLTHLRNSGMSPRASYKGDGDECILSERFSQRLTGVFSSRGTGGRATERNTVRMTERTSKHFTIDCTTGEREESFRSNARLTDASLRELAECDVREPADKQKQDVNACMFGDDFFTEMPTRGGERRNVCHHLSNMRMDGSNPASPTVAGSARAVVKALRPMRSAPSASSPLVTDQSANFETGNKNRSVQNGDQTMEQHHNLHTEFRRRRSASHRHPVAACDFASGCSEGSERKVGSAPEVQYDASRSPDAPTSPISPLLRDGDSSWMKFRAAKFAAGVSGQ